jgi:diguanylate cyclase (GGDEF)-like protein
MSLWGNRGERTSSLARAMARLARMPAAATWGWGIAGLLGIVALDGAARSFGLRLVPLYVPLLCAIFWALGGRQTIGFALVAAIVALLPDIVVAPDPLGPASAANAAIRGATYLFLALIIAAYRRAYDEADYRAMYDALTGALNRMPFEAAIVRRQTLARRARETLLAASIDLDGFKQINKTYGQAAGDAALRAFSEEALRAVRGSDLFGRLGGDKFGFLLGASSAQNAEALAHLLHQRVTSTLAKSGLPLSCSMGALVVGPNSTLTDGELFERASGLMRQVKEGGKGKVRTEIAPGG